MSKIFISYAREDIDCARTVANGLLELGHTVWWDQHLTAATNWSKEIVARINSSDSVIAIWSRHAAKSEWVAKETALAAKRGCLVLTIASQGDQIHVPAKLASGPPVLASDLAKVLKLMLDTEEQRLQRLVASGQEVRDERNTGKKGLAGAAVGAVIGAAGGPVGAMWGAMIGWNGALGHEAWQKWKNKK